MYESAFINLFKKFQLWYLLIILFHVVLSGTYKRPPSWLGPHNLFWSANQIMSNTTPKTYWKFQLNTKYQWKRWCALHNHAQIIKPLLEFPGGKHFWVELLTWGGILILANGIIVSFEGTLLFHKCLKGRGQTRPWSTDVKFQHVVKGFFTRKMC
jgi:hypothetical protein